MEYKGGSYYVLLFKYTETIFRYKSHITDDNWDCISTHGYVIMDGVYHHQNILFNINNENKILDEISFEDMKKYLPNNHPGIIEFRNKRIQKILKW